MSRLALLVGCFGLFVSASSTPQQEDRAGEGSGIEKLLDIDFRSQRKDLFARCSAIAERYEISSAGSFGAAIAELDAYCDLSEKQRRKLDLAVRGTAKRSSRKFQKAVEVTTEIESHEEAYKALSQLADRMRASLAHPERSSFWQSTIERTLTAEQQRSLAQNRDARDAFLKEAWVIDVVREADRYLRLQLGQREQLLKTLREWVRQNEVPEIKRSYRGPWKYVRDKSSASVILQALDSKRRERLIQMAPTKLRDQLTEDAGI